MKQGWEYGILDDAVKKSSSNISLNKIKDEEGNYPVFGAKGFAKNVSFFDQNKDYLAIIKDGAGIGRVSKHPKNSSVLATLQYIIPKDGFDIDFIKYFLNQVDFEKHRNGSTIPHIYFKDYKTEPFPLLPLSEQKRIVKILDEAFAAIDKAKANAEKNLQNSRELFDSYLNKVFAPSAGIRLNSAEGSGQRNPEEDWEEKKLGKVCDFVRGPFGGSLKKQIFVEDGYAVFEQSHAIYNQFERIRYFINDDKFKEMSRFEIRPGNLIMSCSGTMGKVSIVPDGVKQGIINQALLLLKPNGSLFNKFLKYWIESDSFQESLKMYSQGAAIQNVASVKTLKEIQIHFPSLPIQKKIVKKLDEISSESKKLEAIYQQKLADLEELKKSILQKAFDGEL